MICHICHSEAVGQCKDCGKFYCSDHGDLVCVKCRGAEKADPFPDLGEPTAWPGPAKAGPVCYVCQGTTVGACTICGRFYCPQHGGTGAGRRGLCEPCQQSQNTRVKVAFAIAAVWLGIMASAMVYFARSSPQHATVEPPPEEVIDLDGDGRPGPVMPPAPLPNP